jgi:four helix bundle protein
MAKHFSELICWQLARKLRQETFTLTERPIFNKNLNLRGQIRSAASSASSNIVEGFGRLTHREFHRFLEVSRSSVDEIEARLRESVDDGYLAELEIRRALNLCKRTRVATSRFMRSLKERPDPERNRWPRTHRPPST